MSIKAIITVDLFGNQLNTKKYINFARVKIFFYK